MLDQRGQVDVLPVPLLEHRRQHLQRYVNTLISNNSQDVMVGLFPIVVLDMHEHAYVRDYLDDRKSYMVALMREFNWNVVEERMKTAEAIAEAVR